MLTLEKIELRKKTTLRLGGIVPFFYDIRTEDDLLELEEKRAKQNEEIRLLGGGSNLLIADESLGHKNDVLPFSVAQIQINYKKEEKFKEHFIWHDDELAPPLAQKAILEKHTDKTLRAEVGAGMNIQKLIKLCAEQGCTGLEGLMGVPGKVGGAVAMNAGAYGCDIDQVLESVHIYHKDHGIITLLRDSFKNAYRKFTPLCDGKVIEDYIICGASFVFPFIDREKIKETMQENLAAKKNTQPIKAFTAGCVFKNPLAEVEGTMQTISAGQLLDKAGFKGKERNGMRFSPIHANFLENMGNGDANSALSLINEAQETIFNSYNINLEREVKVWL